MPKKKLHGNWKIFLNERQLKHKNVWDIAQPTIREKYISIAL